MYAAKEAASMRSNNLGFQRRRDRLYTGIEGVISGGPTFQGCIPSGTLKWYPNRLTPIYPHFDSTLKDF